MKKLLVLFFLTAICKCGFAQSPTYQDKIYYTCKVWGFAKYYHSRVSTCQVNWDSVLLAKIPAIKNAATNDQFNDELISLLQAAGPMAVIPAPIPDTLAIELKRNLEFDWLSDPVFRTDVQQLLTSIKDNFEPHPVCWVKNNDYTTSYKGWLVFPYDNPCLPTATTTTFPDEASRLLMLFKYWNILNYFNPYNYVMDKPLDSSLHQASIPFANASNTTELMKAVERLAASLNDVHAEGLTWYQAIANYRPQLLLRYVDNKYIVVKSGNPSIQRGDEILEVDGKTITYWEDSLQHSISAGNPAVFHREICGQMLNGAYNSSMTLIVKGQSGVHSETMKRLHTASNIFFTSYFPSDSLSTTTWKKLACNVGYIHMGNLKPADVHPMYTDLSTLPVLIFDIRRYPQGTAWDISDLMYPGKKVYTKITEPNVKYPGSYSWISQSRGINGNTTHYTGKIILLFDENTQSQAEYSCMMLEAMPDVTKVGSQTAATDGNITYFKLTPDIQVGFTTLGIFYPDGDSTQRIGIVPDIVVKPTQTGIQQGRDEVLEKAMEIACNITSVPTTATHNATTIYPNPASDRLHVVLPEKFRKRFACT